jgi:serine/threonine protein kinase
MIESLGSLEGKYEIIENIGEGGMGSVFKVRHKILDEIRVVKMMRSHLVHEQDSRERFFREARIAAKARHRNIAQIFDFSVDEGVAFLIMEFIDGVTLQKAIVDHGRMSVELALEVAQQSLHALAFVHRLGIIHRDISPDNLMLTADSDGNPRIKLIDLGLAKFHEVDSGLTKEGLFLGKLRYASPEQFQTLQGDELGPWCDVYSFGLVLYELVTGKYPIKGRNLAEMMVGHVSEPPMSFSESDPMGLVPLDVRNMILKALSKKSHERFADGNEFRERVLEIQKEFRFGDSEKAEALEIRRKGVEAQTAAGGRTSDQKRLARAFAADESSAGHSSTPAEGFSGPYEGATELRPSGGDDLPSRPPSGTAPSDVTELTPQPLAPAAPPSSAGAGRAVSTDPEQLPGIGSGTEPPTVPFREQRRADRSDAEDRRVVVETGPPAGTGKRDRIIAGAMGVVVLVVAAALIWKWSPIQFGGGDQPVPTANVGTVVVNAMPWARIVEITNGDGEQVPVGAAEYTPAVLSLEPGTYRIVVRHEDYGERTVEMTVAEGEMVSELIPFAEIDENELLRSLRLVE